MRTHILTTALGCALLIGTGPVLADDKAAPAEQPAPQYNDQTQEQTAEEQRENAEEARDEFEEQRTDALRGSEIVGMVVRNSQNQDLGHIEDLMIDVHTGKIHYAALSFGGFLGLGDKLFAVPWQAMQVKFNPQEDERFVVFDIDEERLKEAPGFDQEHWPDSANPEFQKQVDSFHLGEREVRDRQTQ